MHLTALSEDRSVRSTDRAKLQGSCKQWVDCKYVLGCALFVDLLNPCAAFSKAMQAEEIDILGALMSLLRSLKEIEKLAGLPLSQWPTYASTLAAISSEGNGSNTYQGQTLKRFDETQQYFEKHAHEYCLNLKQCLITRLS